jgi:hypothetical protein
MKLNIVPARTGIQWVKLGIRTFARQPLALTGLFFLYTAVAKLLSLVPVVGLVLALGIVPAATLGLMVASREAEGGRFPMPTVLLSAFRAGRERLRAMLVLGVLYAVACFAVMLLVALVSGVSPSAEPATPEKMMTAEFQLSVLVGTLLYLPVSLMFWHAPALVHWYGIPPMKSLFFSVIACLRNARALLLFAAGWMGVMFSAALLVVVVAAMTGSPEMVVAALLPLGLLVTAMFSTSLYFTFRDSFDSTSDDDNVQTPGETT